MMPARSALPVLMLAACAAMAGACSDSTGTPRPVVVDLPADFVFTAQAAGSTDNLDIACQLDFVGSFGTVGVESGGAMGGQLHRLVLLPDESGVSFWGDAYYPDIRVVVHEDRSAFIQAYMNGKPMQPTGESRFWDALVDFTGKYDDASRTISGSWTCRPMDTHEDESGDVTGTWELRAAH